MRNDFVKQTLEEMGRNESIIFLTADLGFKALEPIREAFPERFVNVGVAEQNMISIAAGLAIEGKRVITYSRPLPSSDHLSKFVWIFVITIWM